MSTEDICVYSVKQAAEILQVSHHQIRKMIRTGELSAVRVGREWRIPTHSLRTLLETETSK